jgi:hypothetical protein
LVGGARRITMPPNDEGVFPSQGHGAFDIRQSVRIINKDFVWHDDLSDG